ncbi:hypothetical protein ACFQ05_22690 [Amycolatopsis umgeniensis]|uniref:Uncharacterized protein n=1 Tax=Amycolatopsis umgeniensis TaxID=336628 RepID=A0A841AUP8_9PSEU|nr:hypothetical protein [Amycolatopsis umgeniensis]MBB5850014.1 hypothetical protein [Amycolatopsis umgeniensis]
MPTKSPPPQLLVTEGDPQDHPHSLETTIDDHNVELYIWVVYKLRAYIVEEEIAGRRVGGSAEVPGNAALSGERGWMVMIEIVMVERTEAVRHVYSGDNG